jgi:BioD-like phosphotransacetylase family protein
MPMRVFVAATRQNDGKTTISLGLIFALKKYFKKIGFIKPIGQRYLVEQGYKVDEDSVLIDQICDIKCNLKDMSPVAVERGFTESYIRKPNNKALVDKIHESFDKIARDVDLVIIEGTGHAGVGSVFDLCNAHVAKLLDAKVVLVASGGLGRPIDELVLNKALFDQVGVEVAGVIVNKVLPQKFRKIEPLVRKGLERKGMKVRGVLPYIKDMSMPNVRQIKEEINGEVVYGPAKLLNRRVDNIIIAAMEPHDAIHYFKDNVLVITPGDRDDIMLTAIGSHLRSKTRKFEVVGMVLTGGITPHDSIVTLVKKAKIPVLLSKEDTYRVASRVHDRVVKIRPEDKEKIRSARRLITEHVDIKGLVRSICDKKP